MLSIRNGRKGVIIITNMKDLNMKMNQAIEAGLVYRVLPCKGIAGEAIVKFEYANNEEDLENGLT